MLAGNLFEESHLIAALNTLDSSRWMYLKARLHEDEPSISPADRLAFQHDHERDSRKHVGAV